MKFSNDPLIHEQNCRDEHVRELTQTPRGEFIPVELEVPRPDIQLTEAFHLRKLEATLIDQRDQWLARANGEGNWRDVAHDTQEVRDLAGEMAGLYGPMIAKVQTAAEVHTQLAEGMRS